MQLQVIQQFGVLQGGLTTPNDFVTMTMDVVRGGQEVVPSQSNAEELRHSALESAKFQQILVVNKVKNEPSAGCLREPGAHQSGPALQSDHSPIADRCRNVQPAPSPGGSRVARD